MALRCRVSIAIYPRTGLQNLKMSRIKMQMAININTVHLLHPKKEENGCLYCIKIHATAWHSLVIKPEKENRQGEEKKGQNGGANGDHERKQRGYLKPKKQGESKRTAGLLCLCSQNASEVQGKCKRWSANHSSPATHSKPSEERTEKNKRKGEKNQETKDE
jgi:hypothetical protein